MYRLSPALAPVLCIPGMLYKAGVCLRNSAFDAGFIPVRRPARPVVSVGNLTLGGAGKTPFVIWLAGLLQELGCETAILTRGYGRCKSGKTIIISPGEDMDFPASRIGDEPALIRRRLPDAWLGISSDRHRAANAVIQSRERGKHSDQLIFVLDDGFQRRDIYRDLDIVMINPEQPPDSDRMFPLGALREPVTELRRAQIVVINAINATVSADHNVRIDAITENLRRYAPKANFFNCIRRIQAILKFSDWRNSNQPQQLYPLPETVFLVAAIANPDRFRQDMLNMGIEVRGCAFFRDHAAIGKKDWDACVGAARKIKAEAIIITEKDAVKISNPPEFPLFVAVQSTEISETGHFREILQRCIFDFINRPG